MTGQATREQHEAGDSTLVRLINYDGWERWIAVTLPLPRVLQVPDAPRIFERFADAPTFQKKVPIRTFHLVEYVQPPFGREVIYTEDGYSFDEERLNREDVPSLFRERQTRKRYEWLLMELRRVIDNQREAKSVIGEALVARDSMDRVERIVRAEEAAQHKGKANGE